MTFSNCEISTERQRLSGQVSGRGPQTPFSAVGAFLFGTPFVIVGICVACLGLKIFDVDPNSVHAPYAVLTIVGVVFFVAGFLFWISGWSQYRSNRRRARGFAEGPPALARADYPWDEKGCDAQRWSAVLKKLGAAVLITLFLSVFNWWAFGTKSDFGLKIVVILLDAACSLFWIFFFIELGRAIKFGPSRLEYTQFPFYNGERILLRWITPTGINRADSGNFQLRCVEQWFETVEDRRERRVTLVQEVVWSATYSLSYPENFVAGKTIELAFEPPASAPSTTFKPKEKIVFWELVIALKEQGLDFKQTYLVPVYSRTPTAVAV